MLVHATRGAFRVRSFLLFLTALLCASLAMSAPVLASTEEEIGALPTLDALNRSESPLSNGAKWAALGWDSSTSGTNTGRVTSTGWGPSDAFPTINGAYWRQMAFSDSYGEAAAATMTASPGISERYVSLWLDMPTPGSTRSGYQLRWVFLSGNAYSVTLAKWASGSQTVLASNPSVSIPTGSTLALSDTGGTVQAWQGTGGSLTSILSASDSSFSSGYAGMEGAGNISRSNSFKAGSFIARPDTSISAGPQGVTVPSAWFAFSGTTKGSIFECGLDSAALNPAARRSSTAASPTATTPSRCVRSTPADRTTPAERSFQVVAAAKAVSKTAVLDNFERSEVPLANGRFSKTAWGESIGGAWMGYYRGYGSNGNLASAYWNQGTFGDGDGTVLVAGNVGTGATPEGQYLALWLDMPEPGSVRSGFEARFTGTGSTSGYKVELSRWVAGNRIVMASTSGFSLPVGTTMALSETAGGGIELWTGTTTLTRLLGARDTTYTGGSPGIEVKGGAGTIYNFRAGNIDLQAPDTTIQSGPSGPVLPSEVQLRLQLQRGRLALRMRSRGRLLRGLRLAEELFRPGRRPAHLQGPRARRSRQPGRQPRRTQLRSDPAATAGTGTAGEVKATTATLKGSVNPKGSATTYQFEYGTSTSYGYLAPATAELIGSGTEAVEVSQPITGLEKGTTYHYRLVATNGAGTTKGEDRALMTSDVPEASTEAATNVKASEATLNAAVNPKWAPTTYQFEYGPTASYGSTAPASPQEMGSGGTGVAVSKQVDGLTEGGTYHFRVVATNEVGTTYGADQSFQALLLPSAATLIPGHVRGREAELRGTLNPNGQKTSYQFEYGTTTAYGSRVPLPAEEIGVSSETGEVAEAVSGLEPSTQYHYRLTQAARRATASVAIRRSRPVPGRKKKGKAAARSKGPKKARPTLPALAATTP